VLNMENSFKLQKTMEPSKIRVPELNTLLERDPYLKPYEVDICHR
jgi:hypothetical protein